MSQKRYRPEEIIAKLREADVLLGQGAKVPISQRRFSRAIGVLQPSCNREQRHWVAVNGARWQSRRIYHA